MNIAIAIFGLALLILIHEAGHFFDARAVGRARAASTSASHRRS
jgi:membrane-associated protease RseP (regulator of RpoE activity)